MTTRILCYGDSITWGSDHITDDRSPDRYTRQLAKLLGPDYEVIEEGLGARTINNEDPKRPGRNGLSLFYPIIQTHLPFDILVLQLGYNSTKNRYMQSSQDIITDLKKYFKTLKKACEDYEYSQPKVILVSPHDVNLDIVDPTLGFDQTSAALLRQLDSDYELLASEFSAGFISGYKLLGKGKNGDGVHLDQEQNTLLAQKLFAKIKS